MLWLEKVLQKYWHQVITLQIFTNKSLFVMNEGIVIRGDWLWKAANINDKNNSAVVYVESTVKVHNPTIKMIGMLLNIVHFQVHKNI